MKTQNFFINNDSEYEEAKERFRQIFHACPCITDDEEGMLLYDALEEYEKRMGTKSE